MKVNEVSPDKPSVPLLAFIRKSEPLVAPMSISLTILPSEGRSDTTNVLLQGLEGEELDYCGRIYDARSLTQHRRLYIGYRHRR